MAVYHTHIVITSLSKLDVCYILVSQASTVAFGADHHVLVVRHVLVTSAILEHIAERVVGLSSQRTGRCFKVLFGKYGRDVRRHELIFSHLSRIHPDTEGIVSSSYVNFTYSGNS